MRSIFFILFLATLQPSNTTEIMRVASKSEIADKLKLYQKISSLKTHFTQIKTLKDMGIEIKSEGEMEWSRPNKVVWKVTKPAFTSLTLNGTDIEMESGTPEARKKQHFSLSGTVDASISKSIVSMMAWLKLDVDVIYSLYIIKQTAKNAYLCEPKDLASSIFESLTFYVHPNGHLERLKMNEKSGDSLDIRFAKPTVLFNP